MARGWATTRSWLTPPRSAGGGRGQSQRGGARGVKIWKRCVALALVVLAGLCGCRATVGQVIGQQFVSPVYAFQVPLPGDDWRVVTDDPSALTLTHAQLAAGITISVTCDRERDIPLDVLTRHLFFGFQGVQVIRQETQTLHGAPALKTLAHARLEAHDVQVESYVVRHAGCVYDLVYFASPRDFPRGESTFAQLVAGFRFLN